MFPPRKLKFLIYAIGVQIFFVIAFLLRGSGDDNVPSLNLTDYIMRHQYYVHDHPHWNEDCDLKYGIKMIKDWNTTRYDEAVTRRLCLLINTKVQLYEPFYNIIVSNYSSTSKITMTSDIVSADCEPETLTYNPKKEHMMQYDSLLKLDEFNASRKLNLRCDYTVKHTVFWIWRWDATNVYHFMEDIVNTFVSLILLDEDPNEIEIVIYDGMKSEDNNPLFSFWSELFGSKGVRIIQNNPFPPNTCFRRSITGMYGMRSHFTEYGGYKTDTQCLSPILKGFQDWTTDKLQLKHKFSTNKLTLVFVSRRQYLPNRNITRVLKNEDVIIDTIKEKYPSINVVIFRPEIYSSFKEQVEIVIKGNIMVGVHGAGLAYSLFMAPGSQLIEIFMDDRNSLNRHFHNIASWMELQYQSIGYYAKFVPTEDIVEVIGKAIDNLSKSTRSINRRRG